ncbi:MAG: LemA family protein [Oligoflexia bacterium]|nr:LemA family protein [Oligoflexia bacterium]
MPIEVTSVLIFVFLIVLSIGYFIMVYNKLIKGKNLVREGFSGIEVQLKRRHDLIPMLVDVVAGYSQHEKNLFMEVTELRSKCMQAKTIEEKNQTESFLGQGIVRIMALAENYPELKASTNFLELQKQIADIEENIQKFRNYYNGTVREFNIMVESFPSMIVANIFAFKIFNYFELENKQESIPSKIKF